MCAQILTVFNWAVIIKPVKYFVEFKVTGA